jgi:hypothetical protein
MVKGIDGSVRFSENIELTGADIERITNGKCKIMEYGNLKNFKNLDEAFGIHNAIIILYPTTRGHGHWICLILNDNKVLEFFDPYGLKVDEELKIIKKLHLRNGFGGLEPHLTALINQSEYTVISNTKKLQKMHSHVNTCGRWVSLRVRFREISVSAFIDLMTKNACYDGDFWVSSLTLLL